MPFKVAVSRISLKTEQTIIEKIRYVEAEIHYNLSPLKLGFVHNSKYSYLSHCTLAVSWKVVNLGSGPSYCVL